VVPSESCFKQPEGVDVYAQTDLSVDTCVTILGGCPAEYLVCGDLVEIHFGGPRDGFHFAFDATALGRLMSLGADAMAHLRDAGGEPT
jgi:hypothetical protein